MFSTMMYYSLLRLIPALGLAIRSSVPPLRRASRKFQELLEIHEERSSSATTKNSAGPRLYSGGERRRRPRSEYFRERPLLRGFLNYPRHGSGSLLVHFRSLRPHRGARPARLGGRDEEDRRPHVHHP